MSSLPLCMTIKEYGDHGVVIIMIAIIVVTLLVTKQLAMTRNMQVMGKNIS